MNMERFASKLFTYRSTFSMIFPSKATVDVMAFPLSVTLILLRFMLRPTGLLARYMPSYVEINSCATASSHIYMLRGALCMVMYATLEFLF